LSIQVSTRGILPSWASAAAPPARGPKYRLGGLVPLQRPRHTSCSATGVSPKSLSYTSKACQQQPDEAWVVPERSIGGWAGQAPGGTTRKPIHLISYAHPFCGGRSQGKPPQGAQLSTYASAAACQGTLRPKYRPGGGIPCFGSGAFGSATEVSSRGLMHLALAAMC
jgi:hypothetical protein